VQDLGAGEILLNCIDCDGMTYTLFLWSEVSWFERFYHVLLSKCSMQSLCRVLLLHMLLLYIHFFIAYLFSLKIVDTVMQASAKVLMLVTYPNECTAAVELAYYGMTGWVSWFFWK
jgi:hypothetical protein